MYGARQVGKTTLVKQLCQEYGDGAKYINCDIIHDREALGSQDPKAMKQYIGNYRIVVIDEAQRVKNIGLNLKLLHDSYPELQIIATGSSSFDIAQDIHEPMTGRVTKFMLFPLSVREIMPVNETHIPVNLIHTMLRFGSYPDVVEGTDQDVMTRLQFLASDYLYQDILQFDRIKKSDQLHNILKLLAFQVGSEVSYGEIANTLDLNLLTVEKYIDLLEQCFVIFRLQPYHANLRNQIKKKQKIYFWDLGIRNSIINQFNTLDMRNDQGALRENFVIAERRKRNYYHHAFVNTYFRRNYQQQEIDYLEQQQGELQAYECKRNAKTITKTPAFLKELGASNITVIHP